MIALFLSDHQTDPRDYNVGIVKYSHIKLYLLPNKSISAYTHFQLMGTHLDAEKSQYARAQMDEKDSLREDITEFKTRIMTVNGWTF